MINILLEPMTAQDIAAARREVADGKRLEDSIAFKVFLFCPVPMLDVAAGLATHAVESALSGDPGADLRDVPGAANKDWSISVHAEEYVRKVRGQGRELIRAEVATLEKLCALAGEVIFLIDEARYYVSQEASNSLGKLREQFSAWLRIKP